MVVRFHSIRSGLCLFLVMILFSCGPRVPDEISGLYSRLPQEIDFNFHVRPILSDRCYPCHGPDQNKRKAGLRFDLEESAKGELPENPGSRAIVAGKPNQSILVRRILSPDHEVQMPPPESNLALSDQEKAILIKWIDQGAEWKEHWAFIPPQPYQIPVVEPHTTVNPIDNFIVSKLLVNGLEPSPEADKERLIRRVTMDLTGLPPSLTDIDDFLADNSEAAYEKVVDRLLGSIRYGERMAMEWMDLARYADSHGMHADGWRLMWPWRDWVIKSFNQNMPYDQFVTWQLAGDLIPEATRDQKLATAFHRNHPMTAEGGIVDEEFRLEYVADRTNTTATAFLGLTMECARCHDHKFDPISQKEYYQLSAFFNNVKELGMTGDDGNYGPMLMLPDAKTEKELLGLDQKLIELNQEMKLAREKVMGIRGFVDKLNPQNVFPTKPDGFFPVESIVERVDAEGNRLKYLDNNPSATVSSEPELVSGKFGTALHFDSEYEQIFIEDLGNFELNEPFTAGGWIFCDKPGTNQTIMGTAASKNVFWRGWEFHLDTLNRPGVRLISSLPHNYIDVLGEGSVPKDTWTQVYFTYDGTVSGEGVKIFINGQPVATTVVFDHLYQSIKPVIYKAGDGRSHQVQARPIRVGRSGREFTGDNGVFQGRIDQIKVYEKYLTQLEIAANYQLEVGQHLELGNFPDELLRDHYLDREDPDYPELLRSLRQIWGEKLKLSRDVTEVMVMEDMAEPRPTFVLERGQYDKPKEKVLPGTPQKVLAFIDSLPKNRLGLARWIFDDNNPLTARVAVNRYWQMFFHQGLVRTPHDFGSQGELPSHPELLDWLSLWFRSNGWDVKALVKLMVMSATYRQHSLTLPKMKEKDPLNRLLSHGPSHRLPAELIRDNALATSGLLSTKVGGPSAKPYQSDSLWIELGNFSQMLLYYHPDEGEDLYRRTLYTFIRRTSPHPYLTTFDVTNRSACTVKREVTNTPLQALILLNDPQFVEASRVLAERIQKEGGRNPEAQIEFGFRLATGRKPKPSETVVLNQLYQREKARFTQDPDQASELLEVGDRPPDRDLNPTETAALAMVTGTLLNLDEAYMKR